MNYESDKIDDDHSFGIKTNDSSFVLVNDSGVIPTSQVNYAIYNIGRTEVQAELWYGTEINWWGIATKATIQPMQKKILDNEGKPYYVTGLKIINSGKKRAIVHCEGGDLPSPPLIPTIDLYHILRETFLVGVKFIIHSEISHILKVLLLIFWPEEKPNVWEEISSKIYQLLDENARSIISNLLKNEILMYRDQIKSLSKEWKNKIKFNEHYMVLAYILVGLERKFSFSISLKNYKEINILLLPMYFSVVSLKVNFYLLGIRYGKDFGLTNDNIEQIKRYAYEAFQNASVHINNIETYAVDDTYENSEATNIFNDMMTMRSHLAIHGKEYLPIWEYQLKNPLSKKEIYNPVISYSNFFGKPTPNLYEQATPVNVPQPLCPKLINGKRNVLKQVKIYLWSEDILLKIGGAELIFQNGDNYKMGTETDTVQPLYLKGAKIVEITAYGGGKIDGLKFVLSNGSIKSFGQTSSSSFKKFALEDHHIPSFYLSSDCHDLHGQAANFVVAFQWYDSPSSRQEKALDSSDTTTCCCFNIF